MKKLLISCMLLLGSASLFAKDIRQLVVSTRPQMSCRNCENRIKGNLRFEKGVKKIETSLKDQTVTVTYDADKTDESKISAAFERLDYKVTKLDGESSATKCSETKKECDGNGSCCKK